jgi:hypothetical protein
VAVGDEDVATSMPTVLRARSVTTPSGPIGHIRIFTFGVDDADEFVAEFVRLAERLPQRGLVVDVRGNGGGLIYASERLLQVLTPRPINPEPAQMTTTPLMLDLCRRHAPSPLDPTFSLSPWVESLRQALSTRRPVLNAFTITDETANAVGQRYHGPVVLVTDALCYSATDIFAGLPGPRHRAGARRRRQHGAGGANVWTHDLLALLLPARPPTRATRSSTCRAAPVPVSVRRCGWGRATPAPGRGPGRPPDDAIPDPGRHRGVERRPDGRAGELPGRAPLVSAGAGRAAEVRPDGRVRLRLTTAGLDWVDVAFDDRPVRRSTSPTALDPHAAAGCARTSLDLTGWSGCLVARRREPL